MGTIGDERHGAPTFLQKQHTMMRPRIFKGRGKRTGRRATWRRSTDPQTVSPLNAIPRWPRSSRRGENSPRDSLRRLRVCLRCRHCASPFCNGNTTPSAGAGILTGFPFGARSIYVSAPRSLNCGLGLPLRIGSPVSKCSSHGTLLPLQSSRFSREYLLLPPRSALEAVPPGLATQASTRPPRPPTRRGIALAQRRGGLGSTLERHPFSGLVHSAGKLLHTS